MRGMHYVNFGATPVLAHLPRPIAKAGQVLVRVVTSSVNPVDWKMATGKLPFPRPKLPCVPGYDIAGEVVEVGDGVGGLRVGDHVHARLAGPQPGGCAEFAISGPDVLTRMPETMDFDSAAALPLAGMTALQALRDVARVPVHGARERVQ
ncbi:MAG TPA: alcohol dehydrogenase catalytic domain-containing protein, partial [Myxococcota bacterium]|nr:alcohol dehydrogenase catalytic domain-containing protein [Myxococcota bacterium]